jgi:hypothetical protein
MRKRFNIYMRKASDGLVKHHCPALELEAKGKEVLLETETYLAQALGQTYLGLRDSLEGKELWEMELIAQQDRKAPFTYIGTFTRKLRGVADGWIED